MEIERTEGGGTAARIARRAFETTIEIPLGMPIGRVERVRGFA
jgi:hypothetical protein